MPVALWSSKRARRFRGANSIQTKCKETGHVVTAIWLKLHIYKGYLLHSRALSVINSFETRLKANDEIVMVRLLGIHCVKSVRIRSFSGPYFPKFGLNTERYGVSQRIQPECGKIRTRKSPNTNTFYAVIAEML